MTPRLTLRILCLLAAIGLAGCATTRSRPSIPSLAFVAIPLGAGEAGVSALVSVAGPLEAARGMPPRIEVGLRLDNQGSVRR